MKQCFTHRRLFYCMIFIVIAAIVTRSGYFLPDEAQSNLPRPLSAKQDDVTLLAVRSNVSRNDTAGQDDGRWQDDKVLMAALNTIRARPSLGRARCNHSTIQTKHPPFLADYKNPCWMETLSIHDVATSYKANAMRDFKYPSIFSDNNRYAVLKVLTEQYRVNNTSTIQRLRCVPYFYLAGAAKCGSTELSRRLMKHPNVAATPKEPMWWTRARFGFWVHGGRRVTFQQYVDVYDRAANAEIRLHKNQTIIGDYDIKNLFEQKSKGFESQDEDADCSPIREIQALNPKTKILVILRDPTERLYSEFEHVVRHVVPKRDQKSQVTPDHFHKSVLAAVHHFARCLQSHPHYARRCYFPRRVDYDLYRDKLMLWFVYGFYSVFIRDLLDVFPRGQVMVLRTEDMQRQPLLIMEKIFLFLGLEMPPRNLSQTLSAPKQSYSWRRPMLQKTMEILDFMYEPYKVDLASLLQDEKYLWSLSKRLVTT